MSLDPATVRRIASLARIRVEDHELVSLCADLNSILGWIEQLNAVDIAGVAPLTGAANVTANNAAGGTAMPMRTDVVADGGYPDQVLSNAPQRIGDFYVVPKVVE